jgi:nucleoside-diphosphate-sugar epimerase
MPSRRGPRGPKRDPRRLVNASDWQSAGDDARGTWMSRHGPSVLVTGAGYIGSVLAKGCRRGSRSLSSTASFTESRTSSTVLEPASISCRDARARGSSARRREKPRAFRLSSAPRPATASRHGDVHELRAVRLINSFADAISSALSHDEQRLWHQDRRQPLHGETPLQPVSLYGRTKVDAEAEIPQPSRCLVPLVTVFGASPRMRLDLL